jgi:hypothetical protein
MGGLYGYWRKAITWFMQAFLRIRVESLSSNYRNILPQQGQALHYENDIVLAIARLNCPITCYRGE